MAQVVMSLAKVLAVGPLLLCVVAGVQCIVERRQEVGAELLHKRSELANKDPSFVLRRIPRHFAAAISGRAGFPMEPVSPTFDNQ